MKNKQQLIALITGCSSGIGFESSLNLARNGIYTYATMRNLSRSKEILGCAKRDNLPLKILRLDVTDRVNLRSYRQDNRRKEPD
jgi:NADP-dependent 3-hydroxy acid dehydrogenase YdfG